MSVRIKTSDLNGFLRRMEKRIDKQVDEFNDATEAGAKLGQRTTQKYIASRPSKRSGKSGRYESWSMHDDVDASPVTKNGRSGGSAKYGWIHSLKKYYIAQEEGFKHYLSGQFIGGTHALRDSRVVVRQFMVEAFKR